MFAIWFGAPGMPKITPLDFPAASWALFLTRDVMTIYAGFVFPAKASQWVQDKGLIESPDLADVSMQMTVGLSPPTLATAQFFSELLPLWPLA